METEANESQAKTNEKIGRVLQKILEPDFKIKNEVYLNLFFIRLFDKDVNGKLVLQVTNKELNDRFVQWIIDATNTWEKGGVSPALSLLSFALKLTGHMSSDEQVFVYLNCRNIFESLVGMVKRNSSKDYCAVNGFVKLLCSFLDHKSGVQWVIASSYWTEVINLGLTSNTILIRRKVYQFVTKLLEKTICFNRNFGANLVTILLKPLKDVLRSIPSIRNSQCPKSKSEELFQSLRPVLEFISNVTTSLLKSFNKNVLVLFLEQHITETIEELLLLSRNQDFSFELLKIQFVFLFYKLCLKLHGLKEVSHDSISIHDIHRMFDLIKREMDNNNVRCVIKICDFAHGLYCSLAPRMPLCVRKGEVIEFQNQMVLFQIMPILVFSLQIMCGHNHPDRLYLNDDFRKNFGKRLLKMSAIKSIELCYKWKEKLSVKLDLMEDATFSLQYLVKTKNLLNKERAAALFPALVYCLTDTLTIVTTMVDIDWATRHTNFIITLVDTIVDFVESFDLTWKDSIETLRVMDLAIDFLNYHNWSEKWICGLSRFTDKKSFLDSYGLTLLNTAISKYMSPEMVLLIYSTKNSTVYRTGTLLYAKCHDSTWEIRNGALKVVCTLALNANTKFPSLTDVLLKAELPQLVINMALKDDQCSVRTTAVRCLQQFIQIRDIQDVLFYVDGFLDDLLSIFENESEGVVRKEAAVLIKLIYKQRGVPDNMLPRLYDVMTHATIGDFHFDVRCKALEFWLENWCVLLTNQGMLDQSFPSHTFSKEHRKIIVLNEDEIKKRIIKVLNQLSNTGCLYVLKCAALDEYDIEFSRKAIRGCQMALIFLKKYKVPSENIDLTESPGSNSTQNDQLYQLFEPISPASSTTMTAFSPVGSPQYFDPSSPFPTPLDLALDFNQFTPAFNSTPSSSNSITQENKSAPQSNQALSCDETNYQEESPFCANSSPNTEQDALFCNNQANEYKSDINLFSDMFDVDMLDCEDECLPNNGLQEVNSNECEQVLDDILDANDLTLHNCNHSSPAKQVTNKTSQMKRKTYLAPSEFLKFICSEVGTSPTEKTQSVSPRDEFESLLDDILKEYQIVLDVKDI